MEMLYLSNKKKIIQIHLRLKYILISLGLLVLGIIPFQKNIAQTEDWLTLNSSNSGLSDNSVSCIAIDNKNVKWVGTYNGGLNKIDGELWTVYNRKNSQFPDKSVRAIAIDANNVKWIGTRDGGLVSISDDKKMNIWDTLNSNIHSNWITSIAIDKNNIKWLATRYKGIVKFNNKDFTVIDSSNSKLPVNQILSIVIDKKGIIWAGTTEGLVKIENNNQIVYNKTNSKLPDNRVWNIFVDKNNNKWIGTDAGLIMFNDKEWSNNIYTGHWTLTNYTDKDGNNWIGTYCGGLAKNETNYLSWIPKNLNPASAIYNIVEDHNGNIFFATSDGITIKKANNNKMNKSADIIENYFIRDYALYQNYPNPFTDITYIEYQLPKQVNVRLSVKDIIGNEIAVLVDKNQSEGKYKVNFSTNNLSNGIYFYTLITDDFSATKKMTVQK
jgi:ligand-binding sensor domain-containing protein